MTLHQAPQSRITTSEMYESANTASTSITTATPSTAIRLVTAPPQRSTRRPTGSEQSALTPKYSATTSPSPAGLKPISSPSCTASAPVRNTGSTETVVTVIAPVAARTAPTSRDCARDGAVSVT